LHRAGEQASAHPLAALGRDPMTVILCVHGSLIVPVTRR
jgi:hypothetical protein